MTAAIGIAGAGRMAQALGRLLAERGEPVAAVASRSPRQARAAAAFIGGAVSAVDYQELPAHAGRLLIAVPDHAITPLATLLAQAGMRSGAALHTCGARGIEALQPLAAAGVSCGALHPLQTVADPEQGVRTLPGVAFAVDAQGDAALWANQIVTTLQGQALYVPAGARALYHAAAVVASNYLTTLIATAVMLMEKAGIEESAARRALEPLARASVSNACAIGPAAALTGPIARGDVGTVRDHLRALEGTPAIVTYRAVGLATLELARGQGLGEAPAGVMRSLLEGESRV